uniref:Uncharacterized protein n=1 Tax=Romanomermis culicivorax TaxID=13658 RepID=A0A915JDU3_ROMCU
MPIICFEAKFTKYFNLLAKFFKMAALMITGRAQKLSFFISLALLVGILFIYVNVENLRYTIVRISEKEFSIRQGRLDESVKKSLDIPNSETKYRPGRVLITGRDSDVSYLEHVFDIFGRLGYKNASNDHDWDVFWSHNFPFSEDGTLQGKKTLRPNQLVNHIPGSGFYTSKVHLATSKLLGVPPAFRLPEQKTEFLKFADENSAKVWIQKNNEHRGIKIRKFSDVELNKRGTFVQEYIDNPLLIDNRKFDIGIYTAITSINPLIIYTFDGEVLVRFCPKDYNPFDANDIDKYVIGDDYTPLWEIPSLQKYYNKAKLTRKQTLNAYVRHELNEDPSKIWRQIAEIIRQIFITSKSDFMRVMKDVHFSSNVFELSRFDFVVDENLNVFLMEANMSPNLSSAHFLGNRIMYEQVIFNMLSVVGVANAIYRRDGGYGDEEQGMMVSDYDIAIVSEDCLGECRSCATLACKLCHGCLTEQNRNMLKKAYLQHMNRHAMRRIVPAPT